MGRCSVGLVVGTLTGYLAACGGGAGFSCQQDTDCVLAGTPGVCDGQGHCAYPDTDCASGFSYPVSVPQLGGQCAPQVGGSETGGPDGGGGSQSDDDRGSTLGVDGTTTVLSGTDAGDVTQTGATATQGSSDSAGDSSGGGACLDPDADSLPASTVLGGCEATLQGTLTDVHDMDWFTLFGAGEGCPTGGYELAVESGPGPGMVACIFAGCDKMAGTSNAVCANEATTLNLNGFSGCCGTGLVQGVLGCGIPAESVVDPFFLVTWDLGQAMAPICAPYDLVLSYSGAAAPP